MIAASDRRGKRSVLLQAPEQHGAWQSIGSDLWPQKPAVTLNASVCASRFGVSIKLREKKERRQGNTSSPDPAVPCRDCWGTYRLADSISSTRGVQFLRVLRREWVDLLPRSGGVREHCEEMHVADDTVLVAMSMGMAIGSSTSTILSSISRSRVCTSCPKSNGCNNSGLQN